MLTTEQKKYLAEKINDKINLPILGEKAEFKIIMKALDKIDSVLETEVPDDFKEYLNDVSKGLDPGKAAEIEMIKDNTVKFLNKKVDLPLVGERAEKKIFDLVIDLLLEAKKKGSKLS